MIENEKKRGRITSLLRGTISSFMGLKINIKAMVTVMRIEMTDDLRLARAFISVFPEEKEREIFAALKRKNRELKEFMKAKIKTRILPSVIFEADKSWKMEKKVEELLNKSR